MEPERRILKYVPLAENASETRAKGGGWDLVFWEPVTAVAACRN